jgi:hypothetical protein
VASNAQQNRVAIELAVQCLMRNGFLSVQANRRQGTFPHANITADRGGEKFLVGITSRREIGADGNYNPSYNIVKDAEDMEEARKIAGRRGEVAAFVAIALRPEEGKYSAYFGRLQALQFRRDIPMLFSDRRRYEELVRDEYDERVASLA